MSLIAWAGPETGLRDRASYVLQQGDIRFVLTTPLRPDGGIADHIHRHGDGVRDVALSVDDAKLAWREATRRGARSVHECHDLEDEYGRVKLASVATYGDTIHTFVERHKYHGPFLPGYEPIDRDRIARPAGLTRIDHVAGNVGWNELRRWTDYYNDTLGFYDYPDAEARETFTEFSALTARVVHCANGQVVFPLHEPAIGREKSRIEEYLESYHGPGVQHVALATDDILKSVAALRTQGVEFREVPKSYYDRYCRDLLAAMSAEGQPIAEPLQELQRLGILIDRDEDGYLLQALTQPIEDRPTLCFEIIQRKGSIGFGKGNFQALAEPSK
jgi:4-hydroxyphenylpyruvate dioxygenase